LHVNTLITVALILTLFKPVEVDHQTEDSNTSERLREGTVWAGRVTTMPVNRGT
jgi:hypothetical protein